MTRLTVMKYCTSVKISDYGKFSHHFKIILYHLIDRIQVNDQANSHELLHMR